ncbi:hypothetical protein PWEIH_00885 [Listeria weihenstephanensis FSL R9-0317]|uniref:Uncharacterized protein n=1 Tax=Listeria weihenstephanensis TaxID=1006155 RepID=A0A1S7FWM1_9LIST|nr:hypothetical protein [Listeria weihenstephanensis]AQY51793.1 hypothetical protein UE46_12650 [Listeria weihenstephanensis]EUJ41179.1 hypothetical protein PWEIH_00885 [Listeria weihenstephanensis FSL R9-0317]
MDFERFLLTDTSEFFKFSIEFEDIAYLLLVDTFAKAEKSFGERIFEDDFVPNDNHILVKCGIRRELTIKEREYILSFVEGLLSFKPSIDYLVDFFDVDVDLESGYPEGDGIIDLVERINELFESNIVIKDASTINNIIQK